MSSSPKQSTWQQLVCIAAISTLTLAGCESESGRLERAQPRVALDDTRYFSEPVHFKNLTVWPIHSKSPLKLGEYLTLQEAERKGLAVIREKGVGNALNGSSSINWSNPINTAIFDEEAVGRLNISEEPTDGGEEESQEEGEVKVKDESSTAVTASPEDNQELNLPVEAFCQPDGLRDLLVAPGVGQGDTVNSIVVENRSKLPLLICAGAVVKGGNQDRQIGKDLVIAPGSSVDVESFCIEEGRWTPTRGGSNTNGFFRCTDLVTSSQVRLAAQYETNQKLVWSQVNGVNKPARQSPATGTYLAAWEKANPQSVATRQEYERAVREHLEKAARHGEIVGFAYAVNGKPVSVRTFANGELLEKNLGGFLKAMSLEAELALGVGGAAAKDSAPHLEVASIEDLLRMVRGINEAGEIITSTESGNRNGLRKNDVGGNSNCYIEMASAVEAEASGATEASLVPLTQDWTRKAAQ